MDVAKECGGLPLAIVIVGRALRGKDEPSWRSALTQLRRSIGKNIRGLEENVFGVLEWSYNYLESEEAKSCFLLCSVFPEDSSIEVEDIVRYGIGLKLFESVYSMGEARDRVHVHVDLLKNCFLLMNGYKDGYVKMHDVIRDVAISIASKKEHPFMVRCEQALKEWPENELCGDYGVISMRCNEELYLGKSFSGWDVVEEGKDTTVTNACIVELALLPNLVALDIYVPNIECSVWPSDVVLLENIREFDISLGKKGKNDADHLCPSTNRLALDSLDKSRSFMEIRGLKMLLKITRFLLLHSVTLENHNFFALDEDGFQHLSELEVDNCLDLECLINTSDSYLAKEAFCALKILRLSDLPQLMYLWKGPTQLACLRNLTHVSVFNCLKLKHCVFSLAIARNLVHLQDISIKLCYQLDAIVSNIGGGEHEIESTVAEQEDEIVFPELKSLNLGHLPKFTDFHKAKNATMLPRLKSLKLLGIPKLNCLCLASRSNYDASIQPLFNNKDTLSTVEELDVTALIDLREIWPEDRQAKLREIKVQYCHKVSNVLFSSNLIQCMQKLELLRVDSCNSVEVAFDLSGLYVDEKGDGPAAAIALPCLATLRFLNLPNLKHVWANYPPTILQGFQNLESLRVDNCGSLRILFSPFVARLLVNLRELNIFSCDAMVAIIGWEQEEEEDDDGACTFQGSFLKYVAIENCPAMDSLPSSVQRVINER
ncbi:hypothetical protein Vadar_007017 [Vaccinium darrowii]|uniref:Uncharacterized protein n=1 Tax=Vaccinium darrowii TaxID=229202 RepID=A0ACB7XNW4_9ERIC|nr:hypothetical protein Vadar_007017 [Vaccinium darrowii]